jgi:hypothetical protein
VDPVDAPGTIAGGRLDPETNQRSAELGPVDRRFDPIVGHQEIDVPHPEPSPEKAGIPAETAPEAADEGASPGRGGLGRTRLEEIDPMLSLESLEALEPNVPVVAPVKTDPRHPGKTHLAEALLELVGGPERRKRAAHRLENISPAPLEGLPEQKVGSGGRHGGEAQEHREDTESPNQRSLPRGKVEPAITRLSPSCSASRAERSWGATRMSTTE